MNKELKEVILQTIFFSWLVLVIYFAVCGFETATKEDAVVAHNQAAIQARHEYLKTHRMGKHE